MKNWEKLFLIGIIVSIVAVVAVQQASVQSLALVSKYEIDALRISPDGTEIEEGWLVATLSVDRRDELIFVLKPSDMSIDQAGLPAGSKLQFNGGVSVVLRPSGSPYFSGAVYQGVFSYNDMGDPNTKRYWRYYSLAPTGWTTHVPYQVRASDYESGAVLVPWTTLVAGPLAGWDNVGVDIPLGYNDISVRNLGQLTNGVNPPTTDYAYIWNVKSGAVVPQYVERSYLRSKFTGNNPETIPRRVSIAMSGYGAHSGWKSLVSVGDTGGSFSNIVTTGYPSWEFFNEGSLAPVDSAWASLDTTDITSGKAYFSLNYSEDYWSPDWEFITTFSVGGLGGFVPDKYRVVDITQNTGIPIRNYGTYDMTGGQAILKWGAKWNGTAQARMDFIGATDTWSEFVKQTGIDQLSILTQKFITSVVGIPSSVQLWDRTPSLYNSTVPSTYAQDGLDTGKVCVYESDVMGTSALVQVRVPLSLFDTVIYRPPSGWPLIQSLVCNRIAGGGSSEIVATVKNRGQTEDTFIPQLDLPRGMVVRVNASSKSVEVGQTVEFRWTVGIGNVEAYRRDVVTAIITASGSGLKDTKQAYIDIDPNPAPPIETGDLSVTVLGSVEGTYQPLSGVTVNVSGQEALTEDSGVAVFYDLSEGPNSLSVSAEGYLPFYKDVDIVADTMNQETVRLGIESAIQFILEIIVTIIIIAVVIVVVYLVIKKARGAQAYVERERPRWMR